MKRLNRKKLVLAAYLAAAVLWLIQGAAALAQGVWYGSRGQAPSLELTESDLEFSSIVPYAIDYEPVPGWLVSTDADSHMYWHQQLWVDTVVLDVEQNKPAGGVELYYMEPGQADFSPRQVLYPERDEAGRYVFHLGGRMISGLRIDPDSVGGVLMSIKSLQINPPMPWYQHFVPGAGEWMLLLLVPLVLSALLAEAADLLGIPGSEESRSNPATKE